MIVARVADAAQARGVSAGCEEEGVPCEVSLAAGDALRLGREAALAAPLGLGIGGDAVGLALVLATRPDVAYVTSTDARAIGRAAARLAARRPL